MSTGSTWRDSGGTTSRCCSRRSPGHAPDADLIDRIWERTDGNPFFAEQVLAASRETDEGAVPARLRDVVLARLSTVSDAGQEVLRVASAAGPRIDDEAPRGGRRTAGGGRSDRAA